MVFYQSLSREDDEKCTPQARRKKAGEARLFSEPHEVAGEAGDLVASENAEVFEPI